MRRNRTYQTIPHTTFRKWIITLMVFIGLFFLFFGSSHGTYQLITLELEKRSLQSKKVQLENEYKLLLSQKDSLTTNPAAIEKFARENYNMVRPGEKIYQISPEK